VYHNVTEDHPVRRFFCGLYCAHGHVDFCDVSDLPNVEGGQNVVDVRRDGEWLLEIRMQMTEIGIHARAIITNLYLALK
jgi:hypothetical protein